MARFATVKTNSTPRKAAMTVGPTTVTTTLDDNDHYADDHHDDADDHDFDGDVELGAVDDSVLAAVVDRDRAAGDAG